MADIYFGDTVTTRDGKVGVVAKEKVHDTLHLTVPRGPRGGVAHEAYAVVLESGEVRFYLADALTASDPDAP